MKKVSIGVDVGGTNVKLGLISSSGCVLARTQLKTKNYSQNRLVLIDAIIDTAMDLVKENGFNKKQIRGIGFGLPGLIDPQKGMVKVLPNVPGWKNVPLKKIVQERIKVPVVMDNDVNVITLAEWKHGAGKGNNDLLCITLGTGVGGGLVLGGEIYRGAGFAAGEIGHFPYKDKIFEKYVGNKILARNASKKLRRKINKVIDLYRLTKEGHKGALKFWESVADDLAPTLIGVVNLLNPALIIIGGGVANSYSFFAPRVKKIVKTKAMPVQGKMVKIVRAKLGNDAGLIGAHILLNNATSRG